MQMANTPGLTMFLASSMRRLTRAISTSRSQRRKLLVSRDLGPDTMSLLRAREDLEVQVSLTQLIEGIDELYEIPDRGMAGRQEM